MVILAPVVLLLVTLQRMAACWYPNDGDREPSIALIHGADGDEDPLVLGDARQLVVQGVQQAPPRTALPPGVVNNSAMAYTVDAPRHWQPYWTMWGSAEGPLTLRLPPESV
jgi:hypothetical protein